MVHWGMERKEKQVPKYDLVFSGFQNAAHKGSTCLFIQLVTICVSIYAFLQTLKKIFEYNFYFVLYHLIIILKTKAVCGFQIKQTPVLRVCGIKP